MTIYYYDFAKPQAPRNQQTDQWLTALSDEASGEIRRPDRPTSLKTIAGASETSVVLLDVLGYLAGDLGRVINEEFAPNGEFSLEAETGNDDSERNLRNAITCCRAINLLPSETPDVRVDRFTPFPILGGPIAVLVCHDRVPTWLSNLAGTLAICIESPQFLTRPLVGALGRVARAGTPYTGEGYPRPLQKLPPSPWLDLSPQRRILQPAYRASPVTFDGSEYHEIPGYPADSRGDPLDRVITSAIGKAAPDPTAPGYKLRKLNLVYVLQLCRRLASWGLEGRPVKCTLVLSDRVPNFGPPSLEAKPAGAAGGTDDEVPESDLSDSMTLPVCVECLWVGEPGCRPGLHLSSESLRSHTELVQGDGIAALIDWASLDIAAVISHCHSDDHYRQTACSRLTTWASGPTIAVRDGRVEVYSRRNLALWHDGYEWRWEPFRVAEAKLREFFARSARRDALVERIIAVTFELLDQRSSSLLAFVDQRAYAGASPARPLFAPPGADPAPLLVPMRSNVTSRLHPSDTAQVTTVPLPALRTLLQLDGVHLIERDGGLTSLAYRYIPGLVRGPADTGGGSGRAAAAALSGDLRGVADAGFVIKVSAGGDLLVYENGHAVRPAATAAL